MRADLGDPGSRRLTRLIAVGAVIATAAVATGCGDSDDESVVEAADSWAYPNADLRNTRWVEGDIDSSNVSELAEVWSVPITAAGDYGGYSATPVVVDGVAYTQDLESNVTAIDVESGEVQWEKKYDSPNVGPNGVNVVEGRVYGATTTNAFALNAETGEEVWSRELVRNDQEGIDMAPGYDNGTVYVSTVPGNTKDFYSGNGQAILWAMDAETGEEKWKWEQVPADLWGDRKANSGGGQWHTPAFDEDGDVYVAVANPAPFPITRETHRNRPGENLHTNSCAKLDKETGELEWYYQALPNDPYDWDLQIGPILAESEDGDPVVLCAGKMGYVFGIDQDSGELLWKTPVGRHNGHDEDNLLTLAGDYDQLEKPPFTLYPGILGGVETQMAVQDSTVFVPINNLATEITADEMEPENPVKGTGELVALDVGTGEVQWEHKFDSSAYGSASVVNDLVFTTTFDGTVWALNTETGEVEWEQELPAGTNAPVTIEGDTIITAGTYVSGAGEEAEIVAYRLGAEGAVAAEPDEEEPPAEEQPPAEEEPPAEEQPPAEEPSGGEEQAADGEQLFSQHCATCHVLAAANASGAIGPDLDQLQPPADVVAEQVTNGGGGMPAFGDSLSEAEIQAVADFVSSSAGEGGGGDAGAGAGGGP